MSVRAYRINKIEQEQNSSFNLWHDTELLEFFESKDIYDAREQDGGGYIEVSVEILKEAVKKWKKLKIDAGVVMMLKRDIAWAKKKKDDFVMYSCC